MAHSHGDGGHEESYFTDQVLRVILCGLLGFVALRMYASGTLAYILTASFWPWVAFAGGAIALMTLIRAITLFGQAAEARKATALRESLPNAGHSHAEHSHSHSHSHSHADAPTQEASHGVHDDHDHGVSPWKYVVLAIPVALFFLDLPNGGFSADRVKGEFSKDSVSIQRISKPMAGSLAGVPIFLAKPSLSILKNLKFNELAAATRSPQTRKLYSGRTGTLKGQFQPIGERDFTLYRFKRSCCGADAVPIEVRIICDFKDKTITDFQAGNWVEIEGEIQFAPYPNKPGEYLPVLVIPEISKIKRFEPTTADLYEDS